MDPIETPQTPSSRAAGTSGPTTSQARVGTGEGAVQLASSSISRAPNGAADLVVELASPDTSNARKRVIVEELAGTRDPAEQAALVDVIASSSKPSDELAFAASRSLKSCVAGEPAHRLLELLLSTRQRDQKMAACWALQGCSDLNVQQALLKYVQYESGRKFGDPHDPQPQEEFLRTAERGGLITSPTRQQLADEIANAGNLPHWMFAGVGAKVPVFFLAAEALQGSPHQEIVDGLVRLARSPDPAARLCAVEGLTRSPFPKSSATLFTLMLDRTAVIRSTIGESAAYALSHTKKSDQVVEVLLSLVTNHRAPLMERRFAAIALRNKPKAAVTLARIATKGPRISHRVSHSEAAQHTETDPMMVGGQISDGATALRRAAAEGVNTSVQEAAILLAREITRFRTMREALPLENQALLRDMAERLQHTTDTEVVRILLRGVKRVDAQVATASITALRKNSALPVHEAIASRLESSDRDLALAAWSAVHESPHSEIRDAADQWFRKIHNL